MRNYFCGCYYKCQSETQTIAVIPARHECRSRETCSIQLITNSGAWNIEFPGTDFQRQPDGIRIGENQFGQTGLRLALHAPQLNAAGSLQFGPLTPLRYDIMGPFRFVPFMECRHSVFSMRHTVNGCLTVNGTDYIFQDAIGYLEGDRGHSFPKTYAWTQCSFAEGSLSLAVADIPFGVFHFTGVIAAILWRGRELRLATYLGAKATRIQNGEIEIRQGGYVLTARLLESFAHPLRAPAAGAMTRTIRESAACHAAYRLQSDGQTLFAFESDTASFEYEYPV